MKVISCAVFLLSVLLASLYAEGKPKGKKEALVVKSSRPECRSTKNTKSTWLR